MKRLSSKGAFADLHAREPSRWTDEKMEKTINLTLTIILAGIIIGWVSYVNTRSNNKTLSQEIEKYHR